MPLRVAVIGAGHMGKIHLEKLLAIKDVQVVAVADADEALAGLISGKYGIPFFTDYTRALGNLNGAIIASTTETHFRIAKACLESGAHVFIEKPITSTIEEANELVKYANMKDLTIQIGHLERFNPAYRRAVPYIKNPIFIETRRTSDFTGRSTDIDVVLDLMIHDIDLVLSITRQEVRGIRASGTPFVSDKLDMANATLEFANGCVAGLFVSRISTKKERAISVFESDRFIFIDLLNGRSLCRLKNEEGVIETTEFASDKIDSVMDELSEFTCSIKGEKAPCISGEDGLKALVLANRIKERIV